MTNDTAPMNAKRSSEQTQMFHDGLVAQIPPLRAFAISLSRRLEVADDLVQETLLKAWASADRYQPGTSMRAWLFTILRNTFFSQYRQQSREVQDADGLHSRSLTTPAAQEGALDFADFRLALAKLPVEQREVLIMVGASGMSYQEAAAVCNVAVGTVRSRLSRARAALADLLLRSPGEMERPSPRPAWIWRTTPMVERLQRQTKAPQGNLHRVDGGNSGGVDNVAKSTN